jgi:xanthine dehydrogenase accessory factor
LSAPNDVFGFKMMAVDQDPIAALLNTPEAAVLVVVVSTQGASYNPVGAMMAVWSDGTRVGSLSLGCLEEDIVHHARRALETNAVVPLHYGDGSPYFDIQLPCGGGLQLALVPRPDKCVLRALCERRARREACSFDIDLQAGAVALGAQSMTCLIDTTLHVHFAPKLRFLIFGTGPAVDVFAGLAQAGGFSSMLFSPNESDVAQSLTAGRHAQVLTTKAFPAAASVDAQTAIILLFHDHDWEFDILTHAVRSPAVYIGAQGSRRAQEMRLMALEQRGVEKQARDRIHGPMGLIPSTRDPVFLSVSVLAEILAETQS